MKPKDLIGEKFATSENYNGKPCGMYGWKIVSVLPKDMLELKQVRYSKNMRVRELLGGRIGFGGNGAHAGKWHMPVPRAFGEIVW